MEFIYLCNSFLSKGRGGKAYGKTWDSAYKRNIVQFQPSKPVYYKVGNKCFYAIDYIKNYQYELFLQM
jgi:hypothetical protein